MDSPKNFRSHVREHIPLEQGLRLCCLFIFWSEDFGIREHIPLEQGLRLKNYEVGTNKLLDIREHIPLEQGLRHDVERPKKFFRV